MNFDTQSPLSLSVFSAEGQLLGGNREHAQLLGRPRDAMLGYNWRDWTLPPDVPRIEKLHQRCLAGDPISFRRRVLRPDKSVCVALANVFLCRDQKAPIVIVSMQTIYVRPEIVTPEAFRAARRICDLALELSVIADSVGLRHVRLALGRAAEQAGEIVDLLDRVETSNDQES